MSTPLRSYELALLEGSMMDSMSSIDELTGSDLDQTNDAIFTAELADVSSMNKILHELHHCGDHAVLVINKHGIRLISATEKTYQVSAYFASNTFQRYKYEHDQEKVTFTFLFKDFIESINLLRDDPLVQGDMDSDEQQYIQNHPPQFNEPPITTRLNIQYRKKNEPLKMRLENKSSYVIDVELNAFNIANSVVEPFGFGPDEETGKILLNSRRFYEWASGLDLSTSEFVYLEMGRGEVPLRLITRSTKGLGEVELELCQSSTDIIKMPIEMSNNIVLNYSYRTQYMKPAIEAMKNSALVQIKCGANGLLCIEHFHPPTDKQLAPTGQGMAGEIVHRNSQNTTDWVSQFNQPQNKKSSVEYFINPEAKPNDACD